MSENDLLDDFAAEFGDFVEESQEEVQSETKQDSDKEDENNEWAEVKSDSEENGASENEEEQNEQDEEDEEDLSEFDLVGYLSFMENDVVKNSKFIKYQPWNGEDRPKRKKSAGITLETLRRLNQSICLTIENLAKTSPKQFDKTRKSKALGVADKLLAEAYQNSEPANVSTIWEKMKELESKILEVRNN